MLWTRRYARFIQVSIHDEICTLADKIVIRTELTRLPNSHTFKQREYSVPMARTWAGWGSLADGAQLYVLLTIRTPLLVTRTLIANTTEN